MPVAESVSPAAGFSTAFFFLNCVWSSIFDCLFCVKYKIFMYKKSFRILYIKFILCKQKQSIFFTFTQAQSDGVRGRSLRLVRAASAAAVRTGAASSARANRLAMNDVSASSSAVIRQSEVPGWPSRLLPSSTVSTAKLQSLWRVAAALSGSSSLHLRQKDELHQYYLSLQTKR